MPAAALMLAPASCSRAGPRPRPPCALAHAHTHCDNPLSALPTRVLLATSHPISSPVHALLSSDLLIE
eukprot:6214734-Pleurochrysis_carterae.AAC.1